MSRSLGPALGAFAGAVAIGLVAHLNARVRGRPVWLVTIPGVLVLVPGSVGYRSLLDLVDRDVATSIETALQMFLTAAGIVFGLMLRDAVGARSRRPPRACDGSRVDAAVVVLAPALGGGRGAPRAAGMRRTLSTGERSRQLPVRGGTWPNSSVRAVSVMATTAGCLSFRSTVSAQ